MAGKDSTSFWLIVFFIILALALGFYPIIDEFVITKDWPLVKGVCLDSGYQNDNKYYKIVYSAYGNQYETKVQSLKIQLHDVVYLKVNPDNYSKAQLPRGMDDFIGSIICIFIGLLGIKYEIKLIKKTKNNESKPSSIIDGPSPINDYGKKNHIMQTTNNEVSDENSEFKEEYVNGDHRTITTRREISFNEDEVYFLTRDERFFEDKKIIDEIDLYGKKIGNTIIYCDYESGLDEIMKRESNAAIDVIDQCINLSTKQRKMVLNFVDYLRNHPQESIIVLWKDQLSDDYNNLSMEDYLKDIVVNNSEIDINKMKLDEKLQIIEFTISIIGLIEEDGSYTSYYSVTYDKDLNVKDVNIEQD